MTGSVFFFQLRSAVSQVMSPVLVLPVSSALESSSAPTSELSLLSLVLGVDEALLLLSPPQAVNRESINARTRNSAANFLIFMDKPPRIGFFLLRRTFIRFWFLSPFSVESERSQVPPGPFS